MWTSDAHVYGHVRAVEQVERTVLRTATSNSSALHCAFPRLATGASAATAVCNETYAQRYGTEHAVRTAVVAVLATLITMFSLWRLCAHIRYLPPPGTRAPYHPLYSPRRAAQRSAVTPTRTSTRWCGPWLCNRLRARVHMCLLAVALTAAVSAIDVLSFAATLPSLVSLLLCTTATCFAAFLISSIIAEWLRVCLQSRLGARSRPARWRSALHALLCCTRLHAPGGGGRGRQAIVPVVRRGRRLRAVAHGTSQGGSLCARGRHCLLSWCGTTAFLTTPTVWAAIAIAVVNALAAASITAFTHDESVAVLRSSPPHAVLVVPVHDAGGFHTGLRAALWLLVATAFAALGAAAAVIGCSVLHIVERSKRREKAASAKPLVERPAATPSGAVSARFKSLQSRLSAQWTTRISEVDDPDASPAHSSRRGSGGAPSVASRGDDVSSVVSAGAPGSVVTGAANPMGLDDTMLAKLKQQHRVQWAAAALDREERLQLLKPKPATGGLSRLLGRDRQVAPAVGNPAMQRMELVLDGRRGPAADRVHALQAQFTASRTMHRTLSAEQLPTTPSHSEPHSTPSPRPQRHSDLDASPRVRRQSSGTTSPCYRRQSTVDTSPRFRRHSTIEVSPRAQRGNAVAVSPRAQRGNAVAMSPRAQRGNAVAMSPRAQQRQQQQQQRSSIASVSPREARASMSSTFGDTVTFAVAAPADVSPPPSSQLDNLASTSGAACCTVGPPPPSGPTETPDIPSGASDRPRRLPQLGIATSPLPPVSLSLSTPFSGSSRRLATNSSLLDLPRPAAVSHTPPQPHVFTSDVGHMATRPAAVVHSPRAQVPVPQASPRLLRSPPLGRTSPRMAAGRTSPRVARTSRPSEAGSLSSRASPRSAVSGLGYGTASVESAVPAAVMMAQRAMSATYDGDLDVVGEAGPLAQLGIAQLDDRPVDRHVPTQLPGDGDQSLPTRLPGDGDRSLPTQLSDDGNGAPTGNVGPVDMLAHSPTGSDSSGGTEATIDDLHPLASMSRPAMQVLGHSGSNASSVDVGRDSRLSGRSSALLAHSARSSFTRVTPRTSAGTATALGLSSLRRPSGRGRSGSTLSSGTQRRGSRASRPSSTMIGRITDARDSRASSRATPASLPNNETMHLQVDFGASGANQQGPAHLLAEDDEHDDRIATPPPKHDHTRLATPPQPSPAEGSNVRTPPARQPRMVGTGAPAAAGPRAVTELAPGLMVTVPPRRMNSSFQHKPVRVDVAPRQPWLATARLVSPRPGRTSAPRLAMMTPQAGGSSKRRAPKRTPLVGSGRRRARRPTDASVASTGGGLSVGASAASLNRRRERTSGRHQGGTLASVDADDVRVCCQLLSPAGRRVLLSTFIVVSVCCAYVAAAAASAAALFRCLADQGDACTFAQHAAIDLWQPVGPQALWTAHLFLLPLCAILFPRKRDARRSARVAPK